jgi:hypothetical protein
MRIDSLAICLCMFCVSVCCLYMYNMVVKSWLAPGCMGGAPNRRCTSNRVYLLLVAQWPRPVFQLVTCGLNEHLRLLCNGRRITFSASPISATVALADNQIGVACP